MLALAVRVVQTVHRNLDGAEVIGLIHTSTDRNNEYWERVYEVAWQRPDQCGTHRVHIDSDDHGACFVGHYDMNREEALEDMIVRAGCTPLPMPVKARKARR